MPKTTRREFLGAGAAGGLMLAAPEVPAPFELEEVTILELQSGLRSGKYTSRSLVESYLSRIDSLDRRGPMIRQVIEINPEALDIADRLDKERPRGGLHGIPILIKDNIGTRDRMQTTAGSLALEGVQVSRDAFIVERLRAAGAVILGKTNLSEWANFRSSHSSSGWSGRGGQTRNPYALDRTPSGSSSGSGGAVASNFCAAAVGTETDGSITSPSAACSLVGIKPTLGLVSRSGIVPIAHSQDTAGPMARTVADAAILLGAMTGFDPRDSAMGKSKVTSDFLPYLKSDGLVGARIGVPRNKFYGYSPKTDKLAEQAIAVLKEHGAVIIDPANMETAGKFDDSEFDVLLYEFKADLNAYLAGLGPASPMKSLRDLIIYNRNNKDRELPFFGQEIFEMAQRKGPLTTAAYKKALEKNHLMSRTKGIDAVMDKFKLDALVAPTQGPAWLIDLANGDVGSGGSCTTPAAVAGYPHVTVPMGYVHGLPVGLSFFGRAWSERALIRMAYAFEQATKVRKPPRFLPTAELT